MLYLTTRTRTDAYTSHHALYENVGPDGGFYAPFRMPVFSAEELSALTEKSFGAIVSDVLGLFFTDKITFWDVEYCIGKRPAQIVELPQNITVAQLWQRESGQIEKLEKAIYNKLTDSFSNEIPSWTRIAIRIAFLFAVYAEILKKNGVSDFCPDVAVPAGDCQTLMAAWYARQMGLPLGDILCGCSENSPVWTLLHIGDVKTSVTQSSFGDTADADMPAELERLVYATLGCEETLRFLAAMESETVYSVRKDALETLRSGVYSAVVSRGRILSAISGIFRSTGYIAGPFTAVAYCAVQDHRARCGGNRPTLLLAGRSPMAHGRITSQALGVSEEKLAEMLR